MAESHWETLLRALAEPGVVIPAHVLTELNLTTANRGQPIIAAADALVADLIKRGAEIAPFSHRHAEITRAARERYGKGNGSGGLLNFGDLMVYAIARDRGELMLCTGRDFASTDLALHPASRLEP